MNFMVGATLVALASLAAPVMAQTAAPAAEAKPKGVRMACKQEAVTGSFTRKARQCRHAVGAPVRETSAAAKKPHDAAHAQPAPAATATPPAAAPSPASDVDAAARDTKGF